MSGLFSSVLFSSIGGLTLANLTLAFSGLGGSGLFLATLGVLCGGLGIYLRKAEPPAPTHTQDTGKKKNKKSKKNKKQSDSKPKKNNEGGSLIWGGLALTLLGVGMIAADLMR